MFKTLKSKVLNLFFVNKNVNNSNYALSSLRSNTYKFVILILKLNKHEKNYFNNGCGIRVDVC